MASEATEYPTQTSNTRSMEDDLDKYVPSNEQLIVELYVQDIIKSREFYQQFGFNLVREESNFAVLQWEESRLYLERIEGQPAAPTTTVANIRIMVLDVDRYWEKAQQLGLEVIRPIADRNYGLRDFTVRSPDGIGLRFGTRIATAHY